MRERPCFGKTLEIMKSTLILIALLLSVIFQTTLIPFVAVFGVVPNLVLVLILILIIWKKFENTWWMILLACLFLDLLSGLLFGLISLSLIITAYLIDQFNRNVFSEIKLWIIGSLIVLGSLIYFVSLFSLNSFFQIDFVFNLKYLLIEILYNLLIGSILYVWIKKIFC